MTARKEPPREGTIGRVIYDARLRLGLSQAQLAREIGTRRRNILRWENNENRPARDWSYALAERLGVPLESILDPAVAHIRRNDDARVAALLRETATLRVELADCRKELAALRRQAARAAS